MEYNGYKIAVKRGSVLYEIKPIGRGSVSKELLGLFTTPTLAKETIDRYGQEKTKARKGKQDADNLETR